MLLTVALLLCLDAREHALVAENYPPELLREELEIRAEESDAAPRRETADARTVAPREWIDTLQTTRARDLGSRSARSQGQSGGPPSRTSRGSAAAARQGLRRTSA